MKTKDRICFFTLLALVNSLDCAFTQDLRNVHQFADGSNLSAEAILRTNILWPGEKLFGTLTLINNSDGPKQIPDLDYEPDGRFRFQEISRPDAPSHSLASTYLLKPEFRRKDAPSAQFLRQRQSASFSFEKADHPIIGAPVWEGEFLLLHSYLGRLARFEVVTPFIYSISESEWSDFNLKKDGRVVEKRYLRVFSLEDSRRSAVCYSTSPSRSLQMENFPPVPQGGLKVGRAIAQLLATYNCTEVPYRSIVRIDASLDRDGKIVAIVYPTSESPRKVILER